MRHRTIFLMAALCAAGCGSDATPLAAGGNGTAGAGPGGVGPGGAGPGGAGQGGTGQAGAGGMSSTSGGGDGGSGGAGPVVAACCSFDGMCTDVTSFECFDNGGHSWHGQVDPLTCAAGFGCPDETPGACCMGDKCQIATADACGSGPHFPNQECADVSCGGMP